MMRAALLTLLLVAVPAWAISRDDAARIAQERTGGKVLAVEQQGTLFRVKVLKSNGEVVILKIDAGSGEVR
ncbi:PepSY domain-containing protein [Leeia sp.]|uniref:PepSY domain-containing protein n=1 Tax=Leeia sp. TaxID=2884678 RepID=UPI0035B06D05